MTPGWPSTDLVNQTIFSGRFSTVKGPPEETTDVKTLLKQTLSVPFHRNQSGLSLLGFSLSTISSELNIFLEGCPEIGDETKFSCSTIAGYRTTLTPVFRQRKIDLKEDPNIRAFFSNFTKEPPRTRTQPPWNMNWLFE